MNPHNLIIFNYSSWPHKNKTNTGMNHMRFHFIVGLFFLFVISIPTIAAQTPIDLTNEDWSRGNIHTIKGEFDFYPEQFIAPSQLTLKQSAPVPSLRMSGLTFLSPNNFPAIGYGTFKIDILVPEEKTQLFLFIPDIAKAYTLWDTEKLLATNGIPGTNRAAETPGFQSRVIELKPIDGQISLVLQVSNFHYQWAGSSSPMQLTDIDGVFELKEKKIIHAAVSATTLIAVGILFLLMFSSRPCEKFLLYFGLLCLDMGIRRLLIEERILYFYADEYWSALQGLYNICTYLAFPFFVSYFSYRFPVRYSKYATLISWLITAPFCLLALMTEVVFYTRFSEIFQILILFSFPYVFFVYAKILRQGREGAILFGIGLAIFCLTIISDILTYSHIIDMPFMTHMGVLTFVLFQLVDLLKSYLRNIQSIEKMSVTIKKRNEELLKVDAFKDEFLSTTSHELRTPLHGISGLAKTLLHDQSLTLNNDQRHKLDLISSSSQRLGSLVNDILDFSSIKNDNLKLNLKCVDLLAVSNLVIGSLQPLLAGRDIVLSANISDAARYVLADENRLQQILFNLLGNAVKFTDEGFIQLNATTDFFDTSAKAEALAKNAISADTTKQSVQIEIIDSGMGIPLSKSDSLFEPFQHISEAFDPHYSGNGLGLSITRQLIKQHGGEITIQSEEGEGTSVRFSLALAREGFDATHSQTDDNLETGQRSIQSTAQANLTSVAENSDEPTPENIKSENELQAVHGSLIFVVDDEEVNRELVKAQLTSVGYEVESFGGGKALLEYMDVKTPDLILLDLMMPNINGIEVCRQVRLLNDSYEVPIMMLTARYQVRDIVECLNAGANDYLVKPYHEKELLARVSSQLSARKFWFSNQENQLLKKEIEQRKQLQAELSVANIRLLQALDITDEQIVLLSPDLNILYANQPTLSLISNNKRSLTGAPINEILPIETVSKIKASIEKETTPFSFTVMEETIGEEIMITVRSFQENDENYFALIMSRLAVKPTHSEELISNKLIQDLAQELSESRDKFEKIEHALKSISSFSSEDSSPSTQHDDSQYPDMDLLYKRELLVSLLRTTLNAWERHTQRTKFDLAEESRYWRVYLDGTTAKTRTLDRYLSEQTLPKKPRWQLVARTAQYVLDNCLLPEAESEALSEMLYEVNRAYS
jgi:two-component system, sensor histidine kinase ChiS